MILRVAVSKLTATPVLELEAASDLNHLSQDLLCRCSSSLCTFFLFRPHQCTDSLPRLIPTIAVWAYLSVYPQVPWPLKQPLPVYYQPELLLPFAFIINWKNDSIWDSQTHVFRLITASLALRYIWVFQHLPAGISLKEFVLYLLLQAPGWGGSGRKGLWRIKINMLSQRCLSPFVSFSHLS